MSVLKLESPSNLSRCCINCIQVLYNTLFTVCQRGSFTYQAALWDIHPAVTNNDDEGDNHQMTKRSLEDVEEFFKIHGKAMGNIFREGKNLRLVPSTRTFDSYGNAGPHLVYTNLRLLQKAFL